VAGVDDLYRHPLILSASFYSIDARCFIGVLIPSTPAGIASIFTLSATLLAALALSMTALAFLTSIDNVASYPNAINDIFGIPTTTDVCR